LTWLKISFWGKAKGTEGYLLRENEVEKILNYVMFVVEPLMLTASASEGQL
jgi:hypothetical protein